MIFSCSMVCVGALGWLCGAWATGTVGKLLKGICEMFSAGGIGKHLYCVREGGEAVNKARLQSGSSVKKKRIWSWVVTAAVYLHSMG